MTNTFHFPTMPATTSFFASTPESAMPFDIEFVHARQILDSRGNPTLECEVMLASGDSGRAAVPSGASTGENEAVELRDGDKNFWMGKSVTQAVANVNNTIAPNILGLDARDQETIDRIM